MPATATIELEPAASPDLRAYRSAHADGGSGSHGYVVLLGLRNSDPAHVLRQVESGLAFRAFARLQHNAGLTQTQLTRAAGITPTTLGRRKEGGHFTPEESDRLLRVTRLFAKALDLHEGDVAAARQWLSAPQPALGGGEPLAVAQTEVGAREVESLIDRLENGVFS